MIKSKFIGTSCISLSALHRLVHVEARITRMNLQLPIEPAPPKGSYMGFSRTGNLIYLSGHLPQPAQGALIVGRLGEDLTIEQGQEAARSAALQMLSTLKASLGDLDKVKRIIKINGYVNSTNTFSSQHLVLDGCSNLLGEVFGLEVGRHARAAVACNQLPLGVPVEIEAIVEVEVD